MHFFLPPTFAAGDAAGAPFLIFDVANKHDDKLVTVNLKVYSQPDKALDNFKFRNLLILKQSQCIRIQYNIDEVIDLDSLYTRFDKDESKKTDAKLCYERFTQIHDSML